MVNERVGLAQETCRSDEGEGISNGAARLLSDPVGDCGSMTNERVGFVQEARLS